MTDNPFLVGCTITPDGLAIWSDEAAAILFDRTVDEMRQLAAIEDPDPELVAQMTRDLERRVSEASAHTGSGHIEAIIEYWAKKNLGADVEVVVFDERTQQDQGVDRV